MPPDHSEFHLDAHLDPLAQRLDRLGLAEIAQRLRDLAASPASPEDTFQGGRPRFSLDGLIDVVEAAALLEFRSPSTVHGLIERGVLEGVWHAEQVFVTRDSLHRLQASATLLTQRQMEAQLWSLLGEADLA
jgi:hypothetical protein